MSRRAHEARRERKLGEERVCQIELDDAERLMVGLRALLQPAW